MIIPIVTIGIPVMPQREHYIDKCLQSVVHQTFSEPFEVLIMQNPGFHYQPKLNEIPENVSLKLLTSGKSLSRKRNDIIKHAKGEYIINIDDDVVPEIDWLENMVQEARYYDYDIFWGLAKPIFEKELPKNLKPFEMLIGGFHFDHNEIIRREGLIGCNFGFRKAIKHKRGKFIECIGRGGELIRGGEEILFLAECINPRLGQVKNGIVKHYIQAERIRFAYVIRSRTSNVRAEIFINSIVGKSNWLFLINRINAFIKSFKPKKHFLMNILLELLLLITTIISIASIFKNKHIVMSLSSLEK